MSDDTPDSQQATGDFDPALIPQEKDEDGASMATNRAKADSDHESEPGPTGAGDERTDPNAQPRP